jgi:hypothetical protein
MTYFCHVGATAATLKWEGGGGPGEGMTRNRPGRGRGTKRNV